MTTITTTVAVGVDDTASAQRALHRALRESARAGSDLVCAHAWQLPDWAGALVPTLAEQLEKQARVVLDTAVDTAVHTAAVASDDERPGRVTRLLVEGAPGPVLCELSQTADLLVVGGRGHGFSSYGPLGSVTAYALHHAACPVMVVPDPGAAVSDWDRVVVGLDGSSSSRDALHWAARRAERDGLPLVAVHALAPSTLPGTAGERTRPPWDYMEQAETWLRKEVATQLPDAERWDVRYVAEHRTAAAALLDEAGPGDLLVLGARGSGGFDGLLLGSVAAQCSRHSRSTLVVVRRGRPESE